MYTNTFCYLGVVFSSFFKNIPDKVSTTLLIKSVKLSLILHIGQFVCFSGCNLETQRLHRRSIWNRDKETQINWRNFFKKPVRNEWKFGHVLYQKQSENQGEKDKRHWKASRGGLNMFSEDHWNKSKSSILLPLPPASRADNCYKTQAKPILQNLLFNYTRNLARVSA